MTTNTSDVRSPSKPSQDEARRYEFTTVETSGQPHPPASCACSAAIDDSIYVFGGVLDQYATNSYTFYDHLSRFDTDTRHWTRLTPDEAAPSARAFSAAVADQRRRCVYVFGGTRYRQVSPAGVDGYQAFNELWSYEVDDNRWRLLSATDTRPDHPAGRASPALWLADDRLYLFGGAGPTVQALNDLWAFDLGSRTWEQLRPPGPIPAGRLAPAHHCFPIDNKLVLCGGEEVELINGQLSFALLSDTWEFDLARGNWSETTATAGRPAPASYAASALIEDVLYTYGGDTVGGDVGPLSPVQQNPTDQLWGLSPAGEWRRLTASGPHPRIKCHTGCTIADSFYFFGGYDFHHDGSTGQVWNHGVYRFRPAHQNASESNSPQRGGHNA